MTTIESAGTGPINYSTGRANHVFWAVWNGTDRDVLRGFVDGSAPETYVDPTPGTYFGPPALSDEHLVWIVKRDVQPNNEYLSVELDYSPVPDHPSDVVVTAGPSIPATAGLLQLKIGGDYAATVGCFKTDGSAFECRPFVARLSTKKVWRLRPRVPGYYVNTVLGVSDDEIVLGETDGTKAGVGSRIRRMVRFKTASLDTWGDAL